MRDINLDKTSVTAAVKGAMTAKDVERLREIENEVAEHVSNYSDVMKCYVRVFSESIAAQIVADPNYYVANRAVDRARDTAAAAVRAFAKHARKDVAGATEVARGQLVREKWLEEANKAK